MWEKTLRFLKSTLEFLTNRMIFYCYFLEKGPFFFERYQLKNANSLDRFRQMVFFRNQLENVEIMDGFNV